MLRKLSCKVSLKFCMRDRMTVEKRISHPLSSYLILSYDVILSYPLSLIHSHPRSPILIHSHPLSSSTLSSFLIHSYPLSHSHLSTLIHYHPLSHPLLSSLIHSHPLSSNFFQSSAKLRQGERSVVRSITQ